MNQDPERLAKNVFRVHGIDDKGTVRFNRAFQRKDLLKFFDNLSLCLVCMEAFGSAHHWGREISKFGYDVTLMPTVYVKP